MDATHMQLIGRIADRDSWTPTRCSLDRAFGVVGTRSAMPVLREAYYGTTRFDAFAERTGLTEPVTAHRLKELVAVGILARREYQEPGQRRRSEYVLTESGLDLLPAVLGLLQWGDEHLAPQAGGPPLRFKHRGCGHQIVARVECSAGHEVAVQDIEVRSARTTSAHAQEAAQ